MGAADLGTAVLAADEPHDDLMPPTVVMAPEPATPAEPPPAPAFTGPGSAIVTFRMPDDPEDEAAGRSRSSSRSVRRPRSRRS